MTMKREKMLAAALAACLGAFGEGFTLYNVAQFSPGNEKVAAADAKEYLERTGNDLVLYSLTLHPEGRPAIEKVRQYVGSFRRFKEACGASGTTRPVRAGILVQAILGHWPRVDKDIEDWTRTVDAKGEKVRFCPLDPGFAQYITDTFTLLAKEHPAFILTDDDIRAFSHEAECFCPLHMELFNKRRGTSYTADELRARLKGARQDDPDYVAFFALQREMLDGVVKRARAAIDAVDPSIPGGICIANEEHLFCAPLARGMASAGQTPVMRTATASYMERMTAAGAPRCVCRMMGFEEYYRGSGIELLCEADTWPHNLWSKSSRSFFTHLTAAAFVGMNGAKTWYVNSHKGPFAVSRSYTDVLAENRGFLPALAEAVAGSDWEGLAIPCFTNFPRWHVVTNHNEFFVEDGNMGETTCIPFGIPFQAVREFDADRVYALSTAAEVARLSDDDIRRILSHRAVVFRSAAGALSKRGFDALTGVRVERRNLVFNREHDDMHGVDLAFAPSSKDVLFVADRSAEVLSTLGHRPFSGSPHYDVASPAAVLFSNALGGKVLTVQYHPRMPDNERFSEARRAWLLSALDRLSGRQTFAVGHDQDMLVLVRRAAAGERIVLVENLNPDPIRRLSFRALPAGKVERLSGDGSWRTVAATFEDGKITCGVPLAFYEAAVLRITPPVCKDVSLSGAWRVEGEGFSGEAKLPGTLAAAHLGKRWTERDFQTTMDLPQSEALVQEWQYAGRATWTRTVELSAAECKHPMELFLERVMWASEAFWDGESLGQCDSLATPHVHAVPRRLLTPGRHELKLVIDNSCRYNFSRQSHAYGPNMQAVWNGVLGRIVLRRSHPLRSARVFASAPSGGRFEIEPGCDVSAVEVEGLKTSGWEKRGERVVVSLAEEPTWWNEFHPQLYTVRLRAKDGFEHCIRFGFRTVGTEGRHLTLNGVKIFTRGNVENANFAKDGVPWMEKGEWLRVFKTLKDEDGVNAVRFHTWCPPEAAFQAADELGIILHPEAGIWTDGWMSDGDEVGNGKPVDGFVRREMKAIADAYGNSPSFFSLTIGNELGNSNFETMGKWVAEHKRYDPRALCYASSARKLTPADDFSLSHVVPGKGLAREKLYPRTDWDYEDIYSAATIPTVAHEIGQWPVYPIWEELLPKFTGTMRPWNLSRHRDTAAKKNALRFQWECHAASAKLNRLIYKEEVESFLRTPSCAGLQLLEAQDYTGQAEALVGWRDPFYALKTGFMALAPFSSVWGPISYLARFPRFTYVAGETYRAELQIRNLTERPLEAGSAFPYELAGRKGVVKLPNAIAPGDVGTVGVVECALTDEMTRARQTLRFGSNEWNFWVYPREERCALPDGVVKTPDASVMKAALAEGKTVLYCGPSFKSAKGQFKSVYWSARWFPVANTTAAALGTWFDVGHPALAGFVTDDFTDWQWYSLAQGATVHALKGMPEAFRPVALSVNDFHFSDFTATMFEVLVGKGRLFVCGYDLDADTPEAKRLRASLCAYLAVSPAPGTVRMPESWLADEFDAVKAPDLSGAVYDVSTNWTGRVFKMEVKGVPPTTGDVWIDFHQPEKGLTSARGLLEGRVFEVPFTEEKGAKTHVSLPVIREDFLDGRLELEVNLMTGSALAIDRIRVIPRSE